MFDIGWTELLLIGIVALIVVGPKDLPGMFRTLGRFTGKAKGMAREFQKAMNEAADEAGVKDMADDLKKATSKKGLGLDALDDVASKFEDWDPMAASDSDSKGKELSEERAEAARKIHAATAKKATARKAREAAAKPAAAKPAARKAAPARKPATVKKPAAKKKPAARKAAAKPRKAPAKTDSKA